MRLAGFLFFLALPLAAGDWLQFRGPNAGGIAESTAPAAPDPAHNLIWKVAVPPGHSSPVFTDERVFLTAVEGERLLTIALDRRSGETLWTREAPRDRIGKTHQVNNAASASPVSDGENVYVFFGDFGLLAYGPEGDELWRLPLGPFANDMGMSASPILVDGKLVLVCDADTGSYMLGLDHANGEILWKADRSEYTRGFSTPTVYRPAGGPVELVVSGAFQVAGYSLADGEKLWWANGLCWQPKTAPIVEGDVAYVNCWTAGGDSPVESREQFPSFEEVLQLHDADGDGEISAPEAFLPKMRKNIRAYELDKDGAIDERDWNFFLAKNRTANVLAAVEMGGRGDVTETHVRWIERKSLPNVSSPLVYRGVVYTAKDGGIVSALDAETGRVLKRGRLSGAMGKYFASPVASDGRVYFFDEEGVLTVVRAGRQWEILHSLPLGEGGNATPAVVDGRLYVRTHEHLYCFGETAP